MSIVFTANGVTIQTLEEVTAELIAGFQAIYGPDINVSPDSPDGQRVGIFAKALADAQAAYLMLYNQQDPDFAMGQALISKIKYAGITARPATRSYADITVVRNRNVTLGAGFTIIDEIGQEWVLDDPISLTAGSSTVTFYAREFGNIYASPNTINKVVTVVLGVVSVNNPAEAEPGVAEETDEQLRLRRAKSVELPSVTPRGGIFARLANTAGVTEVVVYENDTKVFDPALQLNGNSIWAIVDGGTVAAIAEALAYSKTAGTGTKGLITGIFVETLNGPAGPVTITHSMKFDRPIEKQLFVRFKIKRKTGQPAPDVALIKSTLAARRYSIGDTAFASDLYSDVYSLGIPYPVYDMEISLDGVTWTEESIFSGYDGSLGILEAGITITLVVV